MVLKLELRPRVPVATEVGEVARPGGCCEQLWGVQVEASCA